MGHVLFCVNPLSGGGAGQWFLRELRRRHPDGTVIDVVAPNADSALRRGLTDSTAVVACGGDGTAASVLAQLARSGAGEVPLAILPLGTGNDLARSLGWSPVPCSRRGLDAFLDRLDRARPCRHDVWRLRGPALDRAWHNYWSCGADAAIALAFDRLRERHGRLLVWSWVNKACYGLLGSSKRLPGLARSLVGEGVPLPPWAELVVASNVASYAGGAVLDPRISSADGRLDLHALGHGLPLGLVLAGLRRPLRLASRARLVFRTGRRLPMQCDGEAFLAPRGTYTITRQGSSRLLMAPPPHAS